MGKTDVFSIGFFSSERKEVVTSSPPVLFDLGEIVQSLNQFGPGDISQECDSSKEPHSCELLNLS
jgi:hypothetical protein